MLKVKLIGGYIAVYIGIAVLLELVSRFVFEIDAGGVVYSLIAALVMGQWFAKMESRTPTSGEAWGYALAFTLALAVLSALQFTVLADPEFLHTILGNGALMGFAGALVVVIFLVNRFMFGFGAKNMMRGLKKKTDQS